MKKLLISITLGLSIISFNVNAETASNTNKNDVSSITVCSYKVKNGEWIAKILRDLGSKNPFKDQSYFQTVKLNEDERNVNKLTAGEIIKLPKKYLSQKAQEVHCQNSVVKRVKKSDFKKNQATNLVKKDSAKKVKKASRQRTPASASVSNFNKAEEEKETLIKSNKAKRTSKKENDGSSFPILEYDAALPSGGAK